MLDICSLSIVGHEERLQIKDNVDDPAASLFDLIDDPCIAREFLADRAVEH